VPAHSPEVCGIKCVSAQINRIISAQINSPFLFHDFVNTNRDLLIRPLA
jgi:hypothetical protein